MSAILTSIRRLALRNERKLRKILPAFPRHCCKVACDDLLPLLEAKFPELEFRLTNGWVVRPNKSYRKGSGLPSTRRWDHWYIEVNGVILDPTAGQFFGGAAFKVIDPCKGLGKLYKND